MAVKYLGDGKYMALAADTKPTNAATNAEIWVTDTDDIYRYNGTSWVLLVANDKTETLTNKTISAANNTITIPDSGPARWFIYRIGTTSTGPYKALNKKTGEVEYSGSSLDAVLDPVLTDIEAGDSGTVTSFLSSGGHIYIDGSDAYYDCSAGFDGFTLPQYTTIEGPHNARIRVPSGYASYVFRIPSWHSINPTKYGSSTQAVTINGFSLSENGTGKAWIGVLIEGEADTTPTYLGGVGGCLVTRMRMIGPHTGIKLMQLSAYGWINACYFEKIYMSAPKWAGIEQELVSEPVNEFNYNVFRDIYIQSSGFFPAYGFRNMGYKGTQYINCQVWDVQDGQIKGNIDPRTSGGILCAQDVVINGGILCDEWDEPASGTFSAGHALVLAGYYSAGAAYPKKFQDPGENTMIFGDWKLGGQMSKIYIPPAGGIGGTGILSIEGRNTTAGSNVELIGANDTVTTAVSLYNKSKSERFYFNRQSTSTLIEQVKQTAGGTLRPILFRMNDVPGVGSIESFRINTNGDIQIADTRNIVLNATTGTKIGTATTQKLGFFNKTPIVQKAAIADTSSGAVATVETELNKVKQLLRDYGLLA
jgi:hypothetical protein